MGVHAVLGWGGVVGLQLRRMADFWEEGSRVMGPRG